MAPVPVRFVDAAHVLMSDGWVVRGVCTLLAHFIRHSLWAPRLHFPALPRLPLTTVSHFSRHSVQDNDLYGSAEKQLRQAGSHLKELLL